MKFLVSIFLLLYGCTSSKPVPKQLISDYNRTEVEKIADSIMIKTKYDLGVLYRFIEEKRGQYIITYWPKGPLHNGGGAEIIISISISFSDLVVCPLVDALAQRLAAKFNASVETGRNSKNPSVFKSSKDLSPGAGSADRIEELIKPLITS